MPAPFRRRVGRALESPQFTDVPGLVSLLNTELGGEGFFFGEGPRTEAGFQRVFISKKGMAAEGFDAFLDLRIGPESPGGRVIEMASSKPGTYGIPGFTRVVNNQGTLQAGKTSETFKDFLRASYEYAAAETKPVQSSFWAVYQGLKGESGQRIAGQYNLPSGGMVLTPSSSSGQEIQAARTVRYMVPQGQKQEDFVTRLVTEANVGAIPGLEGYMPTTDKWKALVPMTTSYREAATGVGGTKLLKGQTTRGVGSEFKSTTSVMEARNLANQALVYEGGTLNPLTPSAPTQGTGIRKGWTRSSVILPGEEGTRMVLSKRVLLADQPNLPGAALVSPEAFSFSRTVPAEEATYQVRAKGATPTRYAARQKKEIYAVGESQNIATNLGISSMAQLEQMVESGLQFRETEGQRVRSGKGRFAVGESYGAEITEGPVYDALMKQLEEKKGNRFSIEGKRYIASGGAFREVQPITMERKGYDIRAGRPTMYVPAFYNPRSPEREFSNVPQKGYESTATLVKNLQERFGKVIDIQEYGKVGSGAEEGSEAEISINMPVIGINPPSMKTGGAKAALAPVDIQLAAQFQGVGKRKIDIMTQEGKIPSRMLMTSFGIMNFKTQAEFLRRFLPDSDKVDAVVRYMKDRYTSMGGNVSLNLEEMADIYNAAGNGPSTSLYTAERMFADIGLNILSTADPAQAQEYYKKFGILLPEDQWMPQAAYSEQEMRNLQGVGQEAAEAAGKEMPLQFKEIQGSGAGGKRKQYRLQQRLRAGQAMAIQAGISFVPEYQSQSQYMGPKPIMSLLENYPEAARALGLRAQIDVPGGTREGFAGPMSGAGAKRDPQQARQGWIDMWAWAGFQKDLNEYKPSIPKDAISLTPALSSEIQYAIQQANLETNSEARLKTFQARLNDIDVSKHGLASTVKLANSFFFDENTGTLIPKATSIESVESFKEGAQKGQSRTYISDQYFRMLQSTLMSTHSQQDFSYAAVADARHRFFSRISNEFMPPESGFKGNDIYRNILGVDLPGTRGGRYSGMTGLEAGEVYADDDWIRKMLSNGKMYNKKEIQSIMRYLHSHDDAYLPMLMQRFPDVSGTFVFKPVKMRSRNWLEKRGIKIPDNLATRGAYFITETLGRTFVGDFDADPSAQYMLPITDVEQKPTAGGQYENVHTGAWRLANPAVQEEFDRAFDTYKEGNNAVNRALEGMFGERGVRPGSESLDAARKNMYDYMEAVISSAGQEPKGSLKKRLQAVGEVTLQDLLASATKIKGFKGGMGVAYNRRTMTEDIMDAVLNQTAGVPGHEEIRKRAYESGAMMYQLYLDRQKMVEGGYSPLETLLNSINVGGVGGEVGDSRYRVTYLQSRQGREEAHVVSSEDWTDSIYQQRFADSGAMLLNVMQTLSGSAPDMMSNAMLAWGFGARGRASEVYEALEKATNAPNAGPKARFYALQGMYNKGAVGLSSPFYMAMLYNTVNRLETKNPGAFNDPSVKLPWITGETMSVRDIANTEEFRKARALQNLYVAGKGIVGASEVEMLTQLGGNRMALHALGVFNAWQESTQGRAAVEEAEAKLGKNFENISRNQSRAIMQSKPVVHASEIGALAEKYITGWTRSEGRYKGNAVYQTMTRWMGMSEIFGDRDYRGEVIFKKVELASAIDEDMEEQSHIEMGNTFEKVFAQSMQGRLHHVGQVDIELDPATGVNRGNLTFDVGGLRLTGVPDFVDLDPKTNKVVIKDTKLARSDPSINPDVARRVKSYKNRIQQITYAYGLEKLAQDPDEKPWLEQMRKWHFDPIRERDKLLRMREAAAAGRFSISLQPGYVDRNTGLQTYQEIGIDYGDAERTELEEMAAGIKENTFSNKMIVNMANELRSVLSDPRALPRGTIGLMRTGNQADMRRYGILEELAKLPTVRASGGGSQSGLQKVRVGESGPEEIQIGGQSPLQEKLRGPERVMEWTAGFAGGGKLPSRRTPISRDFLKAFASARESMGLTDERLNEMGLKLQVLHPQDAVQLYLEKHSKATREEAEKDILSEYGSFNAVEDTITIIGQTQRDWKKRAKKVDQTLLARETLAHEVGHFQYERDPDWRKAIQTQAKRDLETGGSKQLDPGTLYGAYGANWERQYATELSASYWEAIGRMPTRTHPERYQAEFEKAWSASTYVKSYTEKKAKAGLAYGHELSEDYLISGYLRDLASGKYQDVLESTIQREKNLEPGYQSWRSKRYRVGESGPEDILIDKKKGEVKIIPTSELPEAKRMRNQPETSKTDQRFQGGVNDPIHFINPFEGEEPPNPNLKGTPTTGPQGLTPAQQAMLPQQGAATTQAPGTGLTLEQFGSMLEKAMKAIQPRITFESRTTPAPLFERYGQAMSQLTQAQRMVKSISGYETEMTEALTPILEEAGLGQQMANIPEGPRAGSLLKLAQANLPPGAYIPAISRMVGSSKDIMSQTKGLEKLIKGLSAKGGTALEQAFPEDIQNQINAISEMVNYGTEPGRANFVPLREAYGAAEQVVGLSKEQQLKPWFKGTLAAAPDEMIEKYARSLSKLVESTDKLASSQGGMIDKHKTYTEVLKQSYDVQVQALQAERQALKAAAGPIFTEEGKMIRPEQVAEGIKRGRITPENLASLRQYATAGKDIRHLEDQMGAEVSERGLGGFFRRTFGGFGLMYMRSIAGLAGSGMYTGFGERQQMEQAVGQAMVGVGGQMPETPMDRIRRIQAVQYGGQGGLLSQNAIANVMQNYQPAYNQLMAGVAGVSSFGAATWLMEGLGFKGRGATLAAAGIGAGTALVSQGLNVAGAVQDPMGSAMALAARQQRGERPGQVNWAQLAGSVGTYAGAGALLGGVPGALVGAGVGLASYGLSDYQNLAGEINPQIKREQAIISALANAGKNKTSPTAIFEQYNIGKDRQAEYMRYAAMVNAPEMGGIPDELLGRASAFSLKYNQPLTNQQVRQYGNMAIAGYDIEKMSQAAAQMSGISLGQMNTTRYEIQQPNTLMGAVASQFGVGSNLPTQGPKGRMVASGTWGSAMTLSLMGQLQGNPLLTEQFTAGMEYAPSLGQAAQWDMSRRGSPQEQAQEMIQRYTAYGKMRGTAWGDVYRAQTADYYQRLTLGMQTGPKPSYEQFAQQAATQPVMAPEQYKGFQDMISREGALTQTGAATRGIYTGQLGMSSGQADTLMAQMTNMAVASFQQAQAQYAASLQSNLVGGGLTGERAQQIGQQVAGMSGPAFSQFQDMAKFNPIAIADWYQKNQGKPGAQLLSATTVQGYGGAIPISNTMLTDVNAKGQLTGLPWGTTSLASPFANAQQMAGMVFGQKWATNGVYGQFGTQAINAMVNGIEAPWGGELQGMQAFKLYQLQLNRNYQKQQESNQAQQLQMAMAFQTGVGLEKYSTVNPQTGKPFNLNVPGGMWGIEDRQRALAAEQQTYAFQSQQRDIESQNRWWQAGFNLNLRQSTMQRGWTREDWGYQDQVRGLQWQWRTEDFDEQKRFLTGRERRIAERQMKRETTMYNIEGEQIDKTRARQEELWKLEDERFKNEKRQHEEQVKNAKEDLKRAREFWEENKKLQDQQLELSRAYWTEQQKLAQKALEQSSAYAEKQYQLQLVMLALETYIQNASGALNRLNQTSMAQFVDMIAEVDSTATTTINNVTTALKEFVDVGQETSNLIPATNDNGTPVPRASGGMATVGTTYEVEETEKEFFKPNTSGTIIPLSKLKDPWMGNLHQMETPSSAPSQPTTIVINLGNERLARFVVDTVDKEINL